MNRKEEEAVVAKQIGKAIQYWRTEVGMSQAALSEKLDVAQQTVQQWEAGKRRISAPTLYLIAKTIQVPYILLFADVESRLEPA